MRSWIKALLISATILAACIFFLPFLAKPSLNSLLPWIMEQADLEPKSFHISRFTWHKINIDNIQFVAPEHNLSADIQGIEVTFSPLSVFSGQIKTASIKKAKLTIDHAGQTNSAQQSASVILIDGEKSIIKDPNVILEDDSLKKASLEEQSNIILTSLEPIFKQLPFDKIDIHNLTIIHPQGTIETQLTLDRKALAINTSIQSPLIKKSLTHNLTLDHLGELNSLFFIDEQSEPIINLHANWTVINDIAQLSLQQSTDIQSLIVIINSENTSYEISTKTAIQASNLELTLPKEIDSTDQILNELAAKGLMQLQINGLKVFDRKSKVNMINNAHLAFNLHTDIDQNREQQWQFKIDTFDVSSQVKQLAPLTLSVKQQLNDPIHVTCSLLENSSKCDWSGKIKQTITAPQLSHNTQLTFKGELNQNVGENDRFSSSQSLRLDTLQKNDSWPKGKNTSQGNITVNGEKIANQWHWKLDIPNGLKNITEYLEPIMLSDGNKQSQAKLSKINWQLFPSLSISGIDTEITQSKPLSLKISQLKLEHKKRILELDTASISCNFDWLKFQYSSQLRNQQTLSQLPLFCDWSLNNKQSHWEKWPVPAFSFDGELTLSSLDLQKAKLETQMHLTGLSKNLDLTLLAQHNFQSLQQGSAQLYLNNFNLDWQQLGLSDMQDLTQVQLLEGSLSAQGWFKWQQFQADIFDDKNIAWRWQPDVMLRIDDMAGIYQETTTWEDIDIQLALRRPSYEDFRIDSQVSALSIHPGIEITNVLARSTSTIKEDFSQALIVIEEVHTDVLGGRINAPLIRFDTSQDINSFGIEIEGLEIEQLAALEAESGVNATGKLDGVLPIILLPEGPQIPAGTLFARAPGGTVSYRGQSAESLKKSDPNVSLAMQVLDDFRYDKLQTNVIYQPDGALNLGLQFQGHNPTFFDGQATHLNLNLEYNLLDLLESLRISNDIVQKLENKYQ